MFTDLQRHSAATQKRMNSYYRNMAAHLKRAAIICGVSEHVAAALEQNNRKAFELALSLDALGDKQQDEAVIKLFESLSPVQQNNVIVTGLASYIAYAVEVSESPNDLACTLRDHLQLTDEELAVYS